MPTAALISPILPLAIIALINFTVGLGSLKDGKIDPVAAATLGFLIASFYAAILVRPSQAVNLFTSALVEGIKDIAGVLFLFMGIGILVTATTQPEATAILNPLIKAVMPSSFFGVMIFFTLPAPAALYGMFSGVACLRTIGNNFARNAGVDTNVIMKKVLPYAWSACVLMMIFVAVLR